MSGEQFSLVWNSFPMNLSSGLYTLFTDEYLVDVTLTAEGRILRAHKIILSICSSYFRELFEENTCKHPIIILKDVNYRDLSAMLHFMYRGEASVKQEDISSFLKLAETLRIKGLTREQRHGDSFSNCNEKDDDDDATTKKSEEPASSCHAPSSPTKINVSYIKIASKGSFETSEMDRDAGSDNVIFNKRHENKADRASTVANEPLDYTSDAKSAVATSDEPLNRGLNANTEDRSSQFMENSQLLHYIQDREKKISGTEDTHESKDSKDPRYGGTSCSRGRRAVRGMPGVGTLPLETTLRVVSEIGPTLRVDRGKVVRMYSCPWCLRHFTRKENLKLHVRYIHGPLESLTCKLCGNKYKNSNSLRVHSYLYHNTRRGKHAKPQLLGGNV